MIYEPKPKRQISSNNLHSLIYQDPDKLFDPSKKQNFGVDSECFLCEKLRIQSQTSNFGVVGNSDPLNCSPRISCRKLHAYKIKSKTLKLDLFTGTYKPRDTETRGWWI